MMHKHKTRRRFLKGAGAAGLLGGMAGAAVFKRLMAREFKISVAGWSLHNEVFGGSSTQLELFRIVREELDIGAFELVNTMLEVPTADYVNRMRREAARHDVEIPLIMIDAEGNLGDADADNRRRAIRDHQKWLYIAADLGCHSVRVNWRGQPRDWQTNAAAMKEFIDRSAPAFAELAEFGDRNGLNVIIENHGGPSSYPEQLTALMEAVDSPRFGTLPDFGNFPDDVDRYDATEAMMPFAKAVSAKCYDFGEDGNETTIDFERMLKICVDQHGYHGYIGIEYEGRRLSERDGIRAARDLLVKLRQNLLPA